MPPILLGIIKDIVHSHPNSEIVAEGIGEDTLIDTVREKRPDVVVLSASAALDSQQLDILMCGGGGRVRVVALNPDHQGAQRHELIPDLVTIDDLSPTSLGEAIISGLSPSWAAAHG